MNRNMSHHSTGNADTADDQHSQVRSSGLSRAHSLVRPYYDLIVGLALAAVVGSFIGNQLLPQKATAQVSSPIKRIQRVPGQPLERTQQMPAAQKVGINTLCSSCYPSYQNCISSGTSASTCVSRYNTCVSTCSG